MAFLAASITPERKELERLSLIVFFDTVVVVEEMATVKGSAGPVGSYKDAEIMRRTSLIVRVIDELLLVHPHCSYCRSRTSGCVYEVGEVMKRRNRRRRRTRQLHHLPRGILFYRHGIPSLLLLKLLQFFLIELDPSFRPALFCSCFYCFLHLKKELIRVRATIVFLHGV